MRWPPKVPSRWPYTAHRDGWVRWYRGKTRFVAGRTVPLAEVEDRWIDLKRQIDSETDVIVNQGTVTVRELFSLFITRQRQRTEPGNPRPLSLFTLRDYVSSLTRFARFVGPDRAVSDLLPSDFAKYQRSLKGTPSTHAREIAYVRAMFKWGDDSGYIGRVYTGPDFVKPTAQALRDRRLSLVRSYSPFELQALFGAATDEELTWMVLGLNGALDNSDISSLTWDVLDLDNAVLDYRRRKVGKVRRVIPLLPFTVELLRERQKSRPRGTERVFLTPTGLPLVRIQPSRKDANHSNPIDYIAMRWSRLLAHSGLRPEIRTKRVDGRRQMKMGGGDGRGFRGLRTTFAQYQPPGYREELEIIMGHAQGGVLLDNYLERVGLVRLRELVDHVWRTSLTVPPLPGPA